MNKAITDGLVLMPPAFANGLGVWSSGDGTPGSDTYAGSGNGAFVPADQDFGGCLELVKTASTQKLRYMGETTLLPGCYLQIKARVKVISGAMPSVRIAAWVGGAGGAHMTGLVEAAPSVALTTYGQVVEVSAIVGTGFRTGVTMSWPNAIFAHVGLDLTGANGGVVRIDDISVEDVTNVFIRDMMGVVDVRDYGARGDGVTDDSAAFEAADADAQGREVLVSAGTYYLGNHVTIENQIHFEGQVTMPADKRLIFQRNFDYATYFDAFQDEDLAFRKAWQALLNFSDHASLNLNGRRIALTGPIDMQAAEGSKTVYEIRRLIYNGQIEAKAGTAWNTTTVTSQATYSASSDKTLTNVLNVAQIAVGSRVSGAGVGREIYVRAVDIAAKTVTLTQPLYDAEGTQVFTFLRYKYILDFSGFTKMSSLNLQDIEFACEGIASGVLLAMDGLTMHFRDCAFSRPKDRAITSAGLGCQGMMIDRCQFLSNEQAIKDDLRTTIGINANANDVKIRNNRMMRFKHCMVLAGTGNLIVGNHWFQGDSGPNGTRQAGLVLSAPNSMSVVTGNYIDNASIELSNEHDATPALGVQYSFGGLSISDNIFTASDMAVWTRFIVVKPYGPGHFIQGLTVTGNTFRLMNGAITRAEGVDTTFADLDYGKFRNVIFQNNTFNAVTYEAISPASVTHVEATPNRIWAVDASARMPFGGRARVVESVVAEGLIQDAANVALYEHPYTLTEIGAAKQQIQLIWKTACKGRARVMVRVDMPQ